jgi:hypothetical protein
MTEKYQDSIDRTQDGFIFEHGPHIANLIMSSMRPTNMTPTDLIRNYVDERFPREGEGVIEWALIHFGYLSLKNADDAVAAEAEIIGHVAKQYIPEFNTGSELSEWLYSHERVDGIATDAGLLRMDLENVAVIGLDSIGVESVREFCYSMAALEMK